MASFTQQAVTDFELEATMKKFLFLLIITTLTGCNTDSTTVSINNNISIRLPDDYTVSENESTSALEADSIYRTTTS